MPTAPTFLERLTGDPGPGAAARFARRLVEVEERKDRNGRPYCVEKGKGRVPCPPKSGAAPAAGKKKPAGKQPAAQPKPPAGKKPPAKKPAPRKPAAKPAGDLNAARRAVDAAKAGKIDRDELRAALAGLDAKQLAALKAHAGVVHGGRKAADAAAAVERHAMRDDTDEAEANDAIHDRDHFLDRLAKFRDVDEADENIIWAGQVVAHAARHMTARELSQWAANVFNVHGLKGTKAQMAAKLKILAGGWVEANADHNGNPLPAGRRPPKPYAKRPAPPSVSAPAPPAAPKRPAVLHDPVLGTYENPLTAGELDDLGRDLARPPETPEEHKARLAAMEAAPPRPIHDAFAATLNPRRGQKQNALDLVAAAANTDLDDGSLERAIDLATGGDDGELAALADAVNAHTARLGRPANIRTRTNWAGGRRAWAIDSPRVKADLAAAIRRHKEHVLADAAARQARNAESRRRRRRRLAESRPFLERITREVW